MVFSEISVNSPESACVRVSFLIKRQSATSFKKEICFTVNFAKFLRVLFLLNTSGFRISLHGFSERCYETLLVRSLSFFIKTGNKRY